MLPCGKKTRFKEYSQCGRTDGSIAKEPFIWITKIKLCILLVLLPGMPLWLFKTAYGSVHFIFTLTSSKYIQEKHALCASLKTIWLVVARAFKLASIYFAPFFNMNSRENVYKIPTSSSLSQTNIESQFVNEVWSYTE